MSDSNTTVVARKPRAAVSPTKLRVAFAGNPNSGKSTLINTIAGTRLHVGNWPGVTVEMKEASFTHDGHRIDLVDLPGTYSLSPYSQEEVIAADYLAKEKPDVIVNVVDATNLERNLYLTVQLLELGIPTVVALNIHDEAEKKGYRIDTNGIEKSLGVTVIATSAVRKTGLDELLDAIVSTADDPERHKPHEVSYGPDIDQAVSAVLERLGSELVTLPDEYPLRWLAIRLVEQDERISGRFANHADRIVMDATEHLRSAHGSDLEALIADARYAVANGIAHQVLKKPATAKVELTERIDSVVLNRFWGIPIFLAAMWFLFKLTFDISTPFVDWMDTVIGVVSAWAGAGLAAIGASEWISSLVIDGIIAGVGTVFVFLPIILAMMFFVTLLEGTGYMARAAFIMDRAMRSIGLHGKSFIPLLMGFGCNVPSIYATRTLENPKDKVLTALLVPYMSCGARLPVYVLFTAAFFATNQGTVLWSLYVLGIVVAMIMGLIFKRTLFRGEPAPAFVMELPPYRMPSFKSLMIHTWEKGRHFVVKAGTWILLASIVVWVLYSLPWGAEKHDTLLGRTGQAVAPVLAPLGFGDWQAGASLVTGVVAKEVVVSTMGEIYAPAAVGEEPAEEEAVPTFGEGVTEIATGLVTAVGDSAMGVLSSVGITSIAVEEPGDDGLLGSLKGTFSPLSAFAFMVFVLLYVPCMIVLVAMRQEFGSWKWAGVSVATTFAAAWVVTFIVYQGGSLLGIGV